MPPKGPKSAPKAAAKKGAPNAMVAKLRQRMELQKAEEERLKREAEEEERRFREEERLAEEQRRFEEAERLAEKERLKEAERSQKSERKTANTQDALARMRAAGMILPDVEQIRREQAAAPPPQPKPKPKPMPKAVVAAAPPPEEEEDDGEATEPTESDAEVDEDDWEEAMERDERRTARHTNNERIRAERAARKEARDEAKRKEAEELKAKDNVLEKVSKLRSPICCVMGHVDTGKTSLLDRIRSTNVQGGEAGGITQQIGATFFPREALDRATEELNKKYKYDLDVPGLLVIDTPGHESFTNLRSRGSSLCDIAILVVDITHGLEQQTRESIRLLREKKCPFIVALNKVDRLYGWESHENMDIQQTLKLQKPFVQSEFTSRLSQVKSELSAEGLNSELYYDNKEVRKCVSIVPTSAKTGEGICDLLLLEIQLVQQFMEGKVTYKNDLQCTILEVKPITGYGFTIDVILINGELHENDSIALCGQNGPIFTQIRSLLTPQPLREMRVRGEYVHHHTIKAAMGVKIAANDLEYVVPGTQLVVVRPEDNKKEIEELVMKDATNINHFLHPDGIGVTVQSSTLGALEALLTFLTDMKIPVANVAIGTIHKRHMHQVLSMKRRMPRYAIILAFDVTVSDDAREIAQKNEIKIFEAKIIYHLFDMFTRYNGEYEKMEKDRLRSVAVFPVQLKMIGDAIHATDPIILPVNITRGQLRTGTPLCVVRADETVQMIGRVMSIERDNRPMEVAKTGADIAVKINSGETGVTAGRQFTQNDTIVSFITRASVDAIKKFKDELDPDDVNLLATLVKVLKVPK